MLGKNLATFRLDLLLFLRDEGDEVVEDVEPHDAGRAPRAGQTVHGRHDDRAEPEPVGERLERDDETGHRAIRNRDDEALPAAALSLPMNERGVGHVHVRHQQRHVRLVAERRGGADDGGRLREAGFLDPRDLRLRGREDHVEPLGVERVAVLDGDRENVRGRLLVTPPAPGPGLRVEEGLAEPLARRPLRRGQARDGEPGMTLKGDDELLARDTRGADDTDAKIAAHDVTSKAVGDTTANRPRGHPPARREADELTLSMLPSHEPAHLTVGVGNVKPRRR